MTILAKIGRFDLVERKMEKLKRYAGDDVAYQMVEAQVSLEKVQLHHGPSYANQHCDLREGRG